jgi:hypothetical protein
MLKYLHLNKIILLVATLCATESLATERDEEIRNAMWNGSDKDFEVVNIPAKWKKASAVIIAQQNSFEYKKPIILNELHFNQYHHYRLKLNDKNAVNKYSEITFSSDEGRRFQVFVGFKIIKPDGKEIIVDPSTAVEMERSQNGKKESYKKIAIPNLEAGDILDYYICEEKIIQTASRIYYFEPVLHLLPRNYPVVKQKLKFDVQRRCFISLRSLNGAPDLDLIIDEDNDEQHYYLEDADREAVPELRWFFPYRELPAIKFRAAYASGKAMRQNDVLLGEPGEVKSSVTKKELSNYVAFLQTNIYTDSKDMRKYVKKNSKKDATNFEIARLGYGYQRNNALNYEEIFAVGWDQTEYLQAQKDTPLQSYDRFSQFLAVLDIPHDNVVVIPKNISSLDDLLLEHELKLLIRVKDGDDYLYISPIDNHAIPGDIDGILDGADAYILDGLAKYKDWEPKRIKLPISDPRSNMEAGDITVKLGSEFDQVDLSVKRTVQGHLKPYHQYVLLDYYDYEDEERARYDMAESFKGTLWMKKKLVTLKESYLASRDKNRNELVKSFVEDEYNFEIKDVTNFEIQQTGRFEETPEMIYSFDATSDKLISKVGPNYLLDLGQLIEKQVEIADDELERKHSVHFSYPRSYKYRITLDIPAGYKVQGLENFNFTVENKHGGFVSTAAIKGGKVIIETYKHYDTIEAPAKEWPQIVDFLNAAHNFTEQKLLLKKG